MTDKWPEFAAAALPSLLINQDLASAALEAASVADALDGQYEKRLGSPPADEFECQMDRLVAANESDIRREERERVLGDVAWWLARCGADPLVIAAFSSSCQQGRFDPPEER